MEIYSDEDGFEYGLFEPVRVELQRPISFEGWLQKNGHSTIGATGALVAQIHVITLHALGHATRASMGKAMGKLKKAEDRQVLHGQYLEEVQPIPVLIRYTPDREAYHATKRCAIKRNKRFDENRD